MKDLEQAFSHYQRANELTTLYRTRHDRRQLTQAVDLIIHSYNKEWLSRTRIDAIAPRWCNYAKFVGPLKSLADEYA